MTDVAETKPYRTPFWRRLPYAKVTPFDIVVAALQKAGKTMCENYATLYAIIYDVLMAKADSSESLIARLQKLRDMDAVSVRFITEQLKQCALLRHALNENIRRGIPAHDRELFFDGAAEAFNDWTIHERDLVEPVDNALQFVIELLTALYDVPHDTMKCIVKKDPSLDEETQNLLAIALRTYLYDDEFDEDFYNDEDDSPSLAPQTLPSSSQPEPETPLTQQPQGSFMSTDENFDSPFWDSIAHAELVTSRAVIPTVTKAGKTVRQNFAVLHDTLYGALLQKVDSPEEVVDRAKALHDLDDPSTDYLRKQLAQCALIRDVLKADTRQAAKQYVWDKFLDYAADNFSQWAQYNPRSEPAEAILQFDIELLAVLYECSPDNVDAAVENDDTMSEDAKKPLIHALRVYAGYDVEDYDDEDDDDEVEFDEALAFSSNAWPTLSAALSPHDQGLFLTLLAPLSLLIVAWAGKELDRNPGHFSSVLAHSIPPCTAFNSLITSIPVDEINNVEKCFLESMEQQSELTQEEKLEELNQTGARMAQAINQLSDADYRLFLSFCANTTLTLRLMLKTLTQRQIESLAKEIQLSCDMLPPGIVLMTMILQGLEHFPRRDFVGELPDAD